MTENALLEPLRTGHGRTLVTVFAITGGVICADQVSKLIFAAGAGRALADLTSPTMVLDVVAIVLFGAIGVRFAVRGRCSPVIPGLVIGSAMSGLIDRVFWAGFSRDVAAVDGFLFELADVGALVGLLGLWHAWHRSG